MMKNKGLVLSVCILCNWSVANASTSSLAQKTPAKIDKMGSHSAAAPRMFEHVAARFVYNYIDFKFNSTIGDNFNRYQGHSNVYSAGADRIKLMNDLYAGLYVFRINTNLNSQFQQTSVGLITGSQNIKNNTIFGHVLKAFNSQIAVDVAGAYGQNNLSSQITLNPVPFVGIANSTNNNWFASIYGIYKKPWNNFVFKANVGALYSQINSGSSFYTFQNLNVVQPIAALTNKVTYIMENAELGYKLTPALTPFINAGLIQVSNYSNSRPLLNPGTIIGAIPQLELNKNGYRLGGGISFKLKQFTLKLEQKYYNSGNTFRSNQTILGLDYQFS